MIQAKCIQKFRDKKGNIYGYRLIDINGQTQDVKPENLKQAIKDKQIHVVNLTLTSDNRLVDSSEKQLQSKKLGESPCSSANNSNKNSTELAKALIILACAIPDPHDKKDMLANVSGLNTTEVNDYTKVLNSIMKDSNTIIKYINNTFSTKNLEVDEYALENFESNLKIETMHNKNSIINAVKYINEYKGLRVDTQAIIKFIKDCNITSLKTASQILEKLCNKFTAFVDSCTNRHDTFGNVSVHKNAFHFDGIVDFVTGYDLYNSDGCNEDIIAIVANNKKLYLQHLYIDENTKENKVIKSLEIKNGNTTSLNGILDNFKKYLDESVMNQSDTGESTNTEESQSNVEEYMSNLQALLEKYFGTVDCTDPCEKVGETVDFTMPDDAKIECYINNKKAKFILWEDDYESFIVECEDITENTIEKAKECIFSYISGNNDTSKICIENGNVCKQKTVTKAESNPLDNLFGAGAL